jgi:hypothetical protein
MSSGNDAMLTSAIGMSSQSRMPAVDSTESRASTRSSRPPSVSSAIVSMSLVSRATTRPEVNRSWKLIDSRWKWSYTRRRRSYSSP